MYRLNSIEQRQHSSCSSNVGITRGRGVADDMSAVGRKTSPFLVNKQLAAMNANKASNDDDDDD